MSNLSLIADQVKSEIVIDANGKGKASIRAVARLMDVSEAALIKSFKSVEGSPSRLTQNLADKGIHGIHLWTKHGIPDHVIPAIAHYYGFEAGRYCSDKAKALWNYYQINGTVKGFRYSSSDKKRNSNPESIVRDRLAKSLIGENPLSEIITPAGRVDLLTNTQIIEVKKFPYWKSALGQVIVYSLYFPERQKRIHLFGHHKESDLNTINRHCNQLNICFTWE